MYNSLSQLPFIPYNIITYLALQDEIIWKMLKYNDYDALSKPNLTLDEKLDLIWKTGPQEKYGVFLTPLVEDAITESRSIMKTYQYYIHAKEMYSSVAVYAFDFLYGGNMSLVEYEGTPVSRGDLFINRILTVLNGAEVGGVGKLIFYDDISRYSLAKSTIGNSKTFTGVCLYMATLVGDTGKESPCDD